MATRLYWLVALTAAMPLTAEAAGTAAGTVISTAAEVSYHFGGERGAVTSNLVTFRVDEVLHVTVAAPVDEVMVTPGEQGRIVTFTVGNVGNSREKVALQLQTNVNGVDFIADPAATPLYFDLDANGALTAADVAYVPGANEPELAADGSIGIIAVVDVPATATDGQRGAANLIASTLTGTGAPGTVFAGQGESGVDAVVGLGGGQATGPGRLRATQGDLAVMKSQVVDGVAGATEATPGSRITYTLQVSPVGPVQATAVTLLDAIPAGTTYVSSSMKVDGQPVTDADDGDAGTLVTSPGSAIRIDLGSLTASDSSRTIEFSVLVN